ncbi:MAG: hypothetical protein AAF982_00855 [Pseudomonadota bacterium]
MSGNERLWPWSELGLERAVDNSREVRRAYAVRLKEIDVHTDVEAFEKLRQAYDHARRITGQADPHDVASSAHQVAVDVLKRHEKRSESSRTRIAQPWSAWEDDVQEPSAKPHGTAGEDNPGRQNSEPLKPNIPSELWQEGGVSDPAILMEKAYRLVNEESLRARDWKVLLASTTLSDPDISMQFQWELINYLNRKMISGGFEASDRWAFYAAIDERFGWVSDGIGFLRKFPQARDLQTAMAKVLREYDGEQKTAPPFLAGKTGVHAKPLPPFLWILPLLIWLILLGL